MPSDNLGAGRIVLGLDTSRPDALKHSTVIYDLPRGNSRRAAIRAVFDIASQSRHPTQPQVFVLKQFTGGGKTYTTAQTLVDRLFAEEAMIRGAGAERVKDKVAQVLICVPTNDNLNQLIGMLEKAVDAWLGRLLKVERDHHWRPRIGTALSITGDAEDEDGKRRSFCKRKDEQRAYIEEGVSPHRMCVSVGEDVKTVSFICPFAKDCRIAMQSGLDGASVGEQKPPKPEYDIIVMTHSMLTQDQGSGPARPILRNRRMIWVDETLTSSLLSSKSSRDVVPLDTIAKVTPILHAALSRRHNEMLGRPNYSPNLAKSQIDTHTAGSVIAEDGAIHEHGFDAEARKAVEAIYAEIRNRAKASSPDDVIRGVGFETISGRELKDLLGLLRELIRWRETGSAVSPTLRLIALDGKIGLLADTVSRIARRWAITSKDGDPVTYAPILMTSATPGPDKILSVLPFGPKLPCKIDTLYNEPHPRPTDDQCFHVQITCPWIGDEHRNDPNKSKVIADAIRYSVEDAGKAVGIQYSRFILITRKDSAERYQELTGAAAVYTIGAMTGSNALEDERVIVVLGEKRVGTPGIVSQYERAMDHVLPADDGAEPSRDVNERAKLSLLDYRRRPLRVNGKDAGLSTQLYGHKVDEESLLLLELAKHMNYDDTHQNTEARARITRRDRNTRCLIISFVDQPLETANYHSSFDRLRLSMDITACGISFEQKTWQAIAYRLNLGITDEIADVTTDQFKKRIEKALGHRTHWSPIVGKPQLGWVPMVLTYEALTARGSWQRRIPIAVHPRLAGSPDLIIGEAARRLPGMKIVGVTAA